MILESTYTGASIRKDDELPAENDDSKCAQPKSGDNLEKSRINKERCRDIEKYRNKEKNE